MTLGVETRGEQRQSYLTIVARLNLLRSLFNPISPGIQLVPLDERTDKPYSKIFFIWFSMNVNILSYGVEFLGFKIILLRVFSGSLLGHWAQ